MSKRASIPSFSEPRPTVFSERTTDRSDVASPHLKLVDATTHYRYERLMGLFNGGVFTPTAEHLVEWLTPLEAEPLHNAIVRISALLPLLGTLDADAERIIHVAVNMDAATWASFIGKVKSRRDCLASLPADAEPSDSELVAGLLADEPDPEFPELDDLDPTDDDLAAVEQGLETAEMVL